jgi:anti-sigma factor RsiW
VKTKQVKVCNTPECRRMRALLSDFLDHTLHWRTTRCLEAHLTACPPCRVYVASVEQTILLYRERPVVDVPVAVRGHLRELLRKRHECAPQKRGPARPAGGGSAASGSDPRARTASRRTGERRGRA